MYDILDHARRSRSVWVLWNLLCPSDTRRTRKDKDYAKLTLQGGCWNKCPEYMEACQVFLRLNSTDFYFHDFVFVFVSFMTDIKTAHTTQSFEQPFRCLDMTQRWWWGLVDQGPTMIMRISQEQLQEEELCILGVWLERTLYWVNLVYSNFIRKSNEHQRPAWAKLF